MNPRRHLYSADALTYRYPRTSAEAFGCDADSARAGWHYRPSRIHQLHRLATYLAACAIGIALAWSLIEWWTT